MLGIIFLMVLLVSFLIISLLSNNKSEAFMGIISFSLIGFILAYAIIGG
jgi:hypothetical protein